MEQVHYHPNASAPQQLHNVEHSECIMPKQDMIALIVCSSQTHGGAMNIAIRGMQSRIVPLSGNGYTGYGNNAYLQQTKQNMPLPMGFNYPKLVHTSRDGK